MLLCDNLPFRLCGAVSRRDPLQLRGYLTAHGWGCFVIGTASWFHSFKQVHTRTGQQKRHADQSRSLRWLSL